MYRILFGTDVNIVVEMQEGAGWDGCGVGQERRRMRETDHVFEVKRLNRIGRAA